MEWILTEVADHHIDSSRRVYYSSGSRITFITVVDVNIWGREDTDVVTGISVGEGSETEQQASASATEAPAKQRNCYAAVVAQRAYIAAGSVGTSPAEFQWLMDLALGERKNKEVFVYIDDILRETETEERHHEVLSEVLKALHSANPKLKPQKCVYGTRDRFSGTPSGWKESHVNSEKIIKKGHDVSQTYKLSGNEDVFGIMPLLSEVYP
ncbi:hypothetical protein ANCCAN_08885 [Ancylostoma caninum]|uniref:Reverse transcriptase domain-containing protein n=1 Tax=Ancylostoma caninum TaxID=29170 RepID=A0A368GL77_ANCCA|nr:hypothetical protein ANCCAN_08885 [Ancylostoma caninum]